MQSTKKASRNGSGNRNICFYCCFHRWVILICYAPMTGLCMSFINYTPQSSGYFADMANSQFVGLDWFKYFFSTDFTKIMRNTLATSLLTLLFSFPLPIILALCLNEVRNQKAKKFVRQTFSLHSFLQTASSTIC